MKVSIIAGPKQNIYLDFIGGGLQIISGQHLKNIEQKEGTLSHFKKLISYPKIR